MTKYIVFCSFLSEGKSEDDRSDAMAEITRQLEKHKVNCVVVVHTVEF